ncbi:SirB2 family protein [Glaciecola sp. XM2]|jgi:uncharacterized membrane protein SirB2|uniref:SirB2 family protein n=1 Tax=Glaciecola sp. XM2 TaxID=1914931 RepID=UPI001BDEF833|nr:SirB2 family protein [Glaciecola sp. XM2]MBT1451025.1 SirB2 family protein [Glaciecola sp. XM2]
MYETAKTLHLSAAILTFVFFIIRFALLMKASPALQKKWLKITPHIADTLLLITIVVMIVMSSVYPFVNGWASSKLAGLVFYILSIAFTLRWAKNNVWRIVGAVSAVFWFYMTARLGLVGPAAFA